MRPTPGNALLPETMPDPADIAIKIQAAKTDLYEEIIDRLATRPGARFTELKPLIGSRNHNVLTKALERLPLEGLVERRGFNVKKTGYVLTGFGVAVRDEIVFHRKVKHIHRLLSREQGEPES